MITIDPHPLLAAGLFVTEFPKVLGDLPTPPETLSLLSLEARAPLRRSEEARLAIRDLLRHGGYKPTGRGKPASEYLVGAVGRGSLPSINRAVDVCNVVSLHSGLPVSVVDLDRASGPLQIAIATPGTRYVFNPTGQEIDVGGLLCLHDRDGACASAVKDSQRTKTGAKTRRTLSVIWGTVALPGVTESAVSWYRSLLEEGGASTEEAGYGERGRGSIPASGL